MNTQPTHRQTDRQTDTQTIADDNHTDMIQSIETHRNTLYNPYRGKVIATENFTENRKDLNKISIYKQEIYAQRAQTSADPEDPDFGLWTPGSEA